MMKKVLIITYYWPPSGGAGVQRWLKFAKYLPELGWQPVILTVDPEFASYPQRDESLAKEVGSDCLVYTTKSFELYNFYKLISGKKEVPYGGFANESKESSFQKISKFLRGNFLLPDPRKGWNKYALKKATELIREFNIETVVTTSPPHSTQLIGLKLKQQFNIRWIADLRDPWTDIYYYNQFKHTKLALRVDKNYERKVIENADVLITVSEDVKRIFAEKSELPIAAKTVVIPNGFDEDDFRITNIPTETKKVITYTGTISEAYDVDCLLEALCLLSEDSKSQLLVRFVGKVPPSVVYKFRSTGLEVELVGYVDHVKSIEYLFRSNLLLLVIPKVKSNQGILTGKFFEYLASQKPVLAIGPTDGDLAKIIQETKCGKLFDYEDSTGMLQFIQEKLIHSKTTMECESASKYSRKELTRTLIELFEAKNQEA
ncbi:MAG: glycosyltransferase family 4 protein [Prolixibacteraceae bacterium]|nr:glycosyltransferase family 4 protein [Prolixibacteraceae bacterium]